MARAGVSMTSQVREVMGPLPTVLLPEYGTGRVRGQQRQLGTAMMIGQHRAPAAALSSSESARKVLYRLTLWFFHRTQSRSQFAQSEFKRLRDQDSNLEPTG